MQVVLGCVRKLDMNLRAGQETPFLASGVLFWVSALTSPRDGLWPGNVRWSKTLFPLSCFCSVFYHGNRMKLKQMSLLTWRDLQLAISSTAWPWEQMVQKRCRQRGRGRMRGYHRKWRKRWSVRFCTLLMLHINTGIMNKCCARTSTLRHAPSLQLPAFCH